MNMDAAEKHLQAAIDRELDAVQRRFFRTLDAELEEKLRDGSFISPTPSSLFSALRRARINACVKGVNVLGRVLQHLPVRQLQLLGETLAHPEYLRVLRYVAGQGPGFALAWIEGRDDARHAMWRVHRVVEEVLDRHRYN